MRRREGEERKPAARGNGPGSGAWTGEVCAKQAKAWKGLRVRILRKMISDECGEGVIHDHDRPGAAYLGSGVPRWLKQVTLPSAWFCYFAVPAAHTDTLTHDPGRLLYRQRSEEEESKANIDIGCDWETGRCGNQGY